MSVDLKPDHGTLPIDERSDTPPLLAAAAITKNFFGSRTALALGVGTLGLILGLLIDGGGSAQTVQAAVPVPAVASRVAAPAACLEALDQADQAIGLAANGFTVVSESYSALAQGDFDRAGDSAAELTAITGRITALTPGYQAAKASCRGL